MTTPRMIKTGLASLVTCLSLGATTAKADLIDGIVDIWTVGVSAEFVCSTAQFSPGTANTACAPSAMSWGEPALADRSGLSITNLPPALVTTNGGLQANTAVTHNNQPVTGNSLDSVTLRSTLTLTPFDPLGGLGLPPASIDFLIDFEETDNGANPCANGEANDQGVNINGCADIFVLDQTALNFPFLYDLDGAGGPLEAREYFISFFELTNGLNPLAAAACAAAGATTDPCFGFLTPESQSTTFQFASLITTEPVVFETPAPASIALFGLALTALGWSNRRKRKI